MTFKNALSILLIKFMLRKLVKYGEKSQFEPQLLAHLKKRFAFTSPIIL